MKRYLFGLALLLPAMSASSQGFSAGVFLGTPMSGVTVSQNAMRISLGIEEKGAAVDGMWDIGPWLARPEYLPLSLYGFGGFQWIDDSTHKWGPRVGVGAATPMGRGNIELYGEAGTTWYWQDDSALKLEGSLGLRIYF
ncbi:hypothetical protein L4D06_08900 [Enterovibrio makurazakiensis]|uniref:hypothetical protein n=1 Tax=Enterovibrio makurazakiensis TaxID=2910232 RepID=UPI003D240BA7